MAEQKFTLGAIPSPEDKRDYIVSAAPAPQAYTPVMLSPLPKIKDQGAVGSCVAHEGSYIAEYYNGEVCSTAFLYGLRFKNYWQSAGMYHRDVLNTLLKFGECSNKECPGNVEMPLAKTNIMGTTDSFTWLPFGFQEEEESTWTDVLKGWLVKAEPRKITSYAKVINADSMKAALANGWPIIFSTGIKNYHPDKKYFIFHPGGNSAGYHSMAVWGWDYVNGKEYFRVSNSWGTNWGDKGWCWMSAEDILLENDAWAIADDTKPEDIRRSLRLTDPYMTGTDVKFCQERLIVHGAEIEADGTFGPKTSDAVIKFQAAKGITADGIVGKDTWEALEKDPDPVDPPKPDPEPEPEPQPEPEPEPKPEPDEDEDDNSIISRFIKWLREQLGFIYVWGGNGEEMTPARIKRMENSDANYQRALALYNKKVAEGMDPVLGYDCSGLVSKFLQNEGIVTKKRNCRHLANMCVKVKELTDVSELERGDLLFRWNSKDSYYHVGVFISENEVIESKGRDYGVVEFAINAFGKDHWNRWGRLECMLEDADNDKDDEEIVFGDPYFAQCSGAQVYVREGGSTAYNAIGVAKKGNIMLAVPTGGWPQIATVVNGVLTIGYMSDKYVEKI